LAQFLLFILVAKNAVTQKKETSEMRYAIAWLLGVPVSVLAIWFVVSHLL
jgi:hypothetical protein